jgi:predicted N-acyltransferase
LSELGEVALSGLTQGCGSPFLSYAWLSTLEATGCVERERGWLPMHIALQREGRLVAFAPAYVKGNSEGEFVFDHAIARYAHSALALRYYPKLIVAVPFTPASGERLLIDPAEPAAGVTAAFCRGLKLLCREAGLSGAHVLFPKADLTDALVEQGLRRRVGVQFQWHNRGYASFDDFLSCFNAKRRHQIRRERKEVAAAGVEVEVLTGSDLTPELADFVFEFYAATVDKFAWGRRYLNRAFFEEILVRLRDRIHLVVARDKASGRRLAGAFNLLGADALFGRYWGSLEERPFLHFEVCFYRGIEEAIARKLARFEPGAGGEHKLARGFEPTKTFSAHYFAHPELDRVASDFLGREETALCEEIARAQAEGPLRKVALP